MIKYIIWSYVALLFCLLVSSALAELPSDRISQIINTKHNFSSISPVLPAGQQRTVGSASETRVCIFCHTPHKALTSYSPLPAPEVAVSKAPFAPLWNRERNETDYVTYDSSSSESTQITPIRNKSKMCLSCHDGTVAIGQVAVLRNRITLGDVGAPSEPGTIPVDVTGNATGVMPDGKGISSGFTSNLGGAAGTDLTNDHPISIVYDVALATVDGELFSPEAELHIGIRGQRSNPLVPLEPETIFKGVPVNINATVECTTCHDPHIRSTQPAFGNIKFLRLHRWQTGLPVQGEFNPEVDIGCIACHNKQGWASSAHASQTVADEVYNKNAALISEFEIDVEYLEKMPVWKISCLNCHDTHTVSGARKLLREGTEGALLLSGVKPGGAPAQEEVCYRCHGPDVNVILQTQGNQTPDIKTEFDSAIRMPITTSDQASTTTEQHNEFDKALITPEVAQYGKDLIEPQVQLGKGDLSKRHVECTDCHDPHRTARTRLAMDPPGTDSLEGGTHLHGGVAMHTNIASGVLRGTWGVEPKLYTGTAFGQPAGEFELKRGDPGTNTSQLVGETYVTREYQVCLKCHSSYAYAQPPPLSNSTGGTDSSGVFPLNMANYTNQAMEFQAPDTHKGLGLLAGDSGAAAGYAANNHRSWHPVVDNTGRGPATYGAAAATFVSPFNFAAGIGNQTMYCSDCHGSATTAVSVVPDSGKPWGPHGSTIDFLLKGPWNATTGTTTPGHLCFKCHRFDDYANGNNPTPNASGFSTALNPVGGCQPSMTNLHVGHAKCLNLAGSSMQCSTCHVAIPHGFKNKALLVNLNDVGPEVGSIAGTQIPLNDPPMITPPYNNPPYYGEALLWINNFSESGQWSATNCADVTGCHNTL